MAQVTSNLNTSTSTTSAASNSTSNQTMSNQTMSNSNSTSTSNSINMFHTNTFNELQVAKLIEGTANTTLIFQVRTTNGQVNVKGGTNYKEIPYGLVIGNFVRASSNIQVSINLSGNSQDQIDRINQMTQYDQDNFGLEVMQQEYIAHPGQVVKIGLSIEDIQSINNYLTSNNTGSAYIEVTTSTAGLLLIGDSTYTPDGETIVKQEMAVVSLAFPVATLTEQFVVSGGAVSNSRFAHISDVTDLSAPIQPIQSGKLQTAYGQLVTNALNHNEMLAKLYSTGSSQTVRGLSGIVKPVDSNLAHIFDNSSFSSFSSFTTPVFQTEGNETIPTFELKENMENVEV